MENFKNKLQNEVYQKRISLKAQALNNNEKLINLICKYFSSDIEKRDIVSFDEFEISLSMAFINSIENEDIKIINYFIGFENSEDLPIAEFKCKKLLLSDILEKCSNLGITCKVEENGNLSKIRFSVSFEKHPTRTLNKN